MDLGTAPQEQSRLSTAFSEGSYELDEHLPKDVCQGLGCEL